MTRSTPRPASARRTDRDTGGAGKAMALLVIASCQLMVVLDITIVNIALPHIQRSLDFSTTSLSWVVNAYTLTFGGLLLLGGRAGDILGRRRVFIVGVLLFVVASLLGGLAQNSGQLLAARALQGVGGAIASPTSLALISTTFREGPERNRAFGVFAAVSAGGGAIGLLAGGMLVEWLNWRWVLFVNVPIGILIALAAPRWIKESERHPGRFDITGALTSTAGMVLLVYGFIRAAQDGWRDALTLASFGAAVVVLVVFVLVERRSRQPITPLHMFADRNRAGTYGIMLCLAAAIFGMFFFLTLFMQAVWGYSALKTGLAYLPFTAALFVGSGTAVQLVPRVGARPLLVVGTTVGTGGLFWLSRISEHSTYLSGVLFPSLVIGVGIGLVFVPASLVALSSVAPADSGVASSLLNTGQQVGGSIGLAVLGTVAWTVVANRVHDHGAQPAATRHDLATGFGRGLLADAGIALLILVITIAAIRVRRADLTGNPQPVPAAPTEPATEPQG